MVLGKEEKLTLLSGIQRRSGRYLKLYLLQRQLASILSRDAGVIFSHDCLYPRAIPQDCSALIYDCVDLPLMHQRTGTALRSRSLLRRNVEDRNAWQMANRANLITYTSENYAPFLRHWVGKEKDHLLLRNLPDVSLSETPENIELAKVFAQLPEVKFRIVIHNTIGSFSGIERALKALNGLPKEFGLFIMGELALEDGEKGVRELAARLAPGHVVRILPPSYGQSKLVKLAAFDLGLTLLDDVSQNLKRCLPNRLTELIAMGVPQIATSTHATRLYAKRYPKHITLVGDSDPHELQKAIHGAWLNHRANPKRAPADFPRWKDEVAPLVERLEEIVKTSKVLRRVSIVTESARWRNSRIAQLTESLQNADFEVSIYRIDPHALKIETDHASNAEN